MMESLIDVLDMSEWVSVLPTLPEDFFNYDKLFKEMYADLSGKVKNNHTFLCGRDDEEVMFLTLRQSNLDHHTASTHKVLKRLRKLRSPAEV